MPPALADALAADPPAAAAYERLSYTHRKEFARWVAEAKQEQTRERRVAKALEMLRTADQSPADERFDRLVEQRQDGGRVGLRAGPDAQLDHER